MIDSSIIVSQDLDFAKREIEGRVDTKLIKTFYADEIEKSGEFKIEFAKEVVKEAYIAEESTKYIVLCAISYNITVQNSLLKLLEEPPRNIVFVVIVKSKTSLLPTIRSRLKIEFLKSEKEPYKLGIEIKNLGLEEIFDFLKTTKNISKDELKEIIQALLTKSLKNGVKFTSTELDMFDKSMELCQLNSRPQYILSYLLLTINQAYHRREI